VSSSDAPTGPGPWVVPPGLDNVIVATTHISHVDGSKGELSYRGIGIDEVIRLFPTWNALVPWLVAGDRAPASAPVPRGAQPDLGLEPMARLADLVLKTGSAWQARGVNLEVPQEGARFITALPRAYAGSADGLPEGDAAAAFLEGIMGRAPSPAEAAALNAYWILAAEHSLNASAFAVRVAASTGSPLPYALAAGILTLAGPLHGGAPTGVLEQLERIRGAKDLEAALWRIVQGGERLMGFGHRVYRTEDPRAARLRTVLRALGGTADAEFAAAVERAALQVLAKWKPDRPLAVNVEFYAALVLTALHIPPEQCPATFACGRLAGWTAHYYEQRREGRLIRPLARYQAPAG
jgi:citrate synthase